MEVLLLMVFTIVGYIIMYRLYGRFIGYKIFKISDQAKAPSVELQDGIDYVPTRKEIIFGHHFTSIAGTGPIVGPAIAIIWGWVPAVLWVFFGSVLMGAVHDFGSLIISMRNQGKSISEFTARYINSRTRVFFFIIVFLTLWIVIAIFGMIIAIIFSIYPTSVLSVWMQIPIAIYLGHLIYKKGYSLVLWSIIAMLLLYLLMFAGIYLPFNLPDLFGIPSTGLWTIVLLIYAYFASVLPVTTLLQPRDYINAYQLIGAMVLITLGIIFSAFFGDMKFVSPAINLNPTDAPPVWPFLFITIACGAISGFHSLVASGTSAKQVKNEHDALFVGYGSMLVESLLALLVIIAVAAGIGLGYTTKGGELLTGVAAWTNHYESWTAAAGLGSKIKAFVDGAANMMEYIGISHALGVVIMGVFVSSFAGTTLDTATRIQRYVISELAGDMKISFFQKRHAATAFAVISAAILAFATGADGKGALALWPMFGAVNQTLAALALIVITLYLKRKGGMKWIVAGLPAIFMSTMTLWASVMNQSEFMAGNNLLLMAVNALIILLVVWIIAEGLLKFFKPGEAK
ncbi:MAG: carbon starvation protein A [Calditrichaceae bacterium]|nr:carbon starvation protein A [Calditrichaceae bacterium]MBN2710154.1 carbon starvation protein A [Calditrichaceae bacterium]RQV95806.1 MAG: carbon starvation protein A [Calditrichota bacterium]